MINRAFDRYDDLARNLEDKQGVDRAEFDARTRQAFRVDRAPERIVLAADAVAEFDRSSDEGASVKVVWGQQFFQVVQYNGFTVGPFEVMGKVRAGESVAEAVVRLHGELARAAAAVGKQKADEHVAELRRLGTFR